MYYSITASAQTTSCLQFSGTRTPICDYFCANVRKEKYKAVSELHVLIHLFFGCNIFCNIEEACCHFTQNRDAQNSSLAIMHSRRKIKSMNSTSRSRKNQNTNSRWSGLLGDGESDNLLSWSSRSEEETAPPKQVIGYYGGTDEKIPMEPSSSLKENLSENCGENLPILLLENECTEYSEEQLSSLFLRDFQTRLFVNGDSLNSLLQQKTSPHEDSVLVRTRHIDDTLSSDTVTKNLKYVQHFFEAAHFTKDHTAAKIALSHLLKSMFEGSSDGEYYATSILLASGMSNQGGSLSFAGDKKQGEEDLMRGRFLLLMDIVFKQVATKKFLIDEDTANIYRLSHCASQDEKGKMLAVSMFSVLLQTCLSFFIVAQVWVYYTSPTPDESQNLHRGLLLLATLGSTFGMFILVQELSHIKDAFIVFDEKTSFLQIADLITNILSPFVIVTCGFWFILYQDSFVDGVINATACL